MDNYRNPCIYVVCARRRVYYREKPFMAVSIVLALSGVSADASADGNSDLVDVATESITVILVKTE